MKLQKLGGYASIALVCMYIAYIFMLRIMYSFTSMDNLPGPAKAMAVYESSPASVKVLTVLVIVIGILFLLIALALRERMREKAPNLMNIAVIAASICTALSLIGGISSLHVYGSVAKSGDLHIFGSAMVMLNSLYRVMQHAFGWMLLMSSLAALSTRAIPRMLGYIIFVYGIGQICLFLVPKLVVVTVILFFISMVWLGIVLIRKPEPFSA